MNFFIGNGGGVGVSKGGGGVAMAAWHRVKLAAAYVMYCCYSAVNQAKCRRVIVSEEDEINQ